MYEKGSWTKLRQYGEKISTIHPYQIYNHGRKCGGIKRSEM